MPSGPAARAELAALLLRVDREVARAAPLCQRSGRCCRFDQVPHELWATELEIEYALECAGAPPAAAPGACPWHVEGLCTAREGRPLGCRTYFCDPGWERVGQELHERVHAQIIALHQRHGLAYAYRRFVDHLGAPRESAS